MEQFNTILAYLLEVLAVLGIVVEITPIKFSPLKWLGDKINGDIKKELQDMKKDIKKLEYDADQRDIGTLRNRISSFENLCRLDIEHTQLKRHQYVTVFKDIDKWNEYHNKYSDLNGELKIAIANIEQAYKTAKFDD